MTAFPIDRAHPPARILYRGPDRELELRPWHPRDVDALLAAVEVSRTELCAFMPWAHVSRNATTQYENITSFRASYFAGREYVFGLFSATGELVGTVGLHPRAPLNPRSLEVGFWCSSPHAGKGWITLGVRVLAALSFHRFDCDRFQVMHDEANLASQRVVERCGFVYEGTLRNALAASSPELVAGGYRASGRNRLYSLVPADLPGLDWFAPISEATRLIDGLGAEQPLIT